MAARPAAPAVATVQTRVASLATRRARMAYARLQVQGAPLGRGSVESAHKVVVASRLQGAGRPWARALGERLAAEALLKR